MAGQTQSPEREEWHEIALMVARKLSGHPPHDRTQVIRDWYRVSLDIRWCLKAAERRMRERVRVAKKRGGQTHRHPSADYFGDVAILAVLRATARQHPSQLVDDDLRCMLLARDEWSEALSEALSKPETLQAFATGAAQTLALSAYAYRQGRQLDGYYAVAAMPAGSGKTNPVTHIAALACVSLGMPTAQISETLEIADHAYVRRLTRAARVA